MTDETTYGLSPERLARLLAIGVENSAPPAGSKDAPTAAVFLRKMLATRLPLEPDDRNSSPSVSGKTHDHTSILSGQTIQELLVGETTSLATLRFLQDSAKRLARSGVPKGKRAAAIVIHYSAVASALVFQNTRITKHSYHEMREAYGKLEKRIWIPSVLKEVFREANRMCRELEATER